MDKESLLMQTGMDSGLNATELLVQVIENLSESEIERILVIGFDKDQVLFHYSNLRSIFEEIGVLTQATVEVQNQFRISDGE